VTVTQGPAPSAQGPAPRAVVYVSNTRPKGPVPEPPPVTVPAQPAPNTGKAPQPIQPGLPKIPAPVIGGLAAGRGLWPWLKLASPLCVHFGTRSLSIGAGVDHTTVAAHLRALRTGPDALIELIDGKRGVDGDL